MTHTDAHRAIYAAAEMAADDAGMLSAEWEIFQSAVCNADLADDDRDSAEWFAAFADSLAVLRGTV